MILEPCGLLPSTLIYLDRAGNIRVSVGSCFTRALPARRSRLRRSALFGRSGGAALRAAFGSGQRFALPWGAFGAPVEGFPGVNLGPHENPIPKAVKNYRENLFKIAQAAEDLRRLTARHPDVKANCFNVKFFLDAEVDLHP